MDIPLSEKDKLFIRENYDGLCNNLQPQPLIDLLHKHKKKVLSNTDLIALNAKGMKDEDKIVFLIFNILLRRGTHSDLKDIRDCLIECDQEASVQFLSDGIIEEPEEEVATVDSEDVKDVNVDKEVVNGKDEVDGLFSRFTKTPPGSNTTSSDSEDSSSDDDSGDMEVVRTAGKGGTVSARVDSSNILSKIKQTFSSKKKGDSDTLDGRNVTPLDGDDEIPTRRMKGNRRQLNRLESFTDAFIHYETKDENSKYGCGICLIFALFTGDLTGYTKDRKILTAFFSGLEYEIKSYENLTKKQIFAKIKETQELIEEKKIYDRLVVVVLTHGETDGLLTCSDEDGVCEEMVTVTNDDGEEKEIKAKIKVEEIVDCFKHDKVPSLKDMPKLFLIQACRGQDVVKAASRTSKQQELSDQDPLELRTKSPIDADICVCTATTDNHPSFVNPHSGSWFIQKACTIFTKHYNTHHVVDMMTVVNLAVAELRSKLDVGNGRFEKAIQIPCIVSTMRRQFYLVNP